MSQIHTDRKTNEQLNKYIARSVHCRVDGQFIAGNTDNLLPGMLRVHRCHRLTQIGKQMNKYVAR